MNVERLRVNHMDRPLGFDLGPTPTFSWEVTGSVGTRAMASRIEVRAFGRVVADTGWVTSTAPVRGSAVWS